MWFARAAEVDELGQTDAEDRLLELDGMLVVDLHDEDAVDGDGAQADAPDAPAADAPDAPAGPQPAESREVDTATPEPAADASPQVSGGAPAPVRPVGPPGLGAEIPALAAPLFQEPAQEPTRTPSPAADDDDLRLFD